MISILIIDIEFILQIYDHAIYKLPKVVRIVTAVLHAITIDLPYIRKTYFYNLLKRIHETWL